MMKLKKDSEEIIQVINHNPKTLGFVLRKIAEFYFVKRLKTR